MLNKEINLIQDWLVTVFVKREHIKSMYIIGSVLSKCVSEVKDVDIIQVIYFKNDLEMQQYIQHISCCKEVFFGEFYKQLHVTTFTQNEFIKFKNFVCLNPLIKSVTMGKNLHPTILPFILQKMESHQYVTSVIDISNDEYYIFRLTRNNGMRDIVVVLSDCYYFGEFDYYSKPAELNEGGFILIARPESTFSSDLQQTVIEDKIIIGKIGILLGALRKDDFWAYEKPKIQGRESK